MLHQLLTYSYIAAGAVITYQAFSFFARHRVNPSATTFWYTLFAFASAAFAILNATYYTVPGKILVVIIEWHFLFGFLIFALYLKCIKDYLAIRSHLLSWCIRLILFFSLINIGCTLVGYARGESLIMPPMHTPFHIPGVLVPRQVFNFYDYSHLGRTILGLVHLPMFIGLIYLLFAGRTSRDRAIQVGLTVSIVIFVHNSYSVLRDPTYYAPLLPFMNLIEITRLEWLARRGELQQLTDYEEKVASFDQGLKEHLKLKEIGQSTASVVHDAINIAFASDTYLNAIQRDGTRSGDTSHEEELQTARANNQRLLDLLTRFRREHLQHNPDEPLDLRTIIDDTKSLMEHRLNTHAIAFSAHGSTDLVVRGDRIKLTMILANLLSNACDAVAEQSERWIRIEVSSQDDKTNIAVINSGEIIPEAMYEDIFKPFFTTKSEADGSGLGLKISRDYAEAMGGELVLNTQSEHTRFDLVLS